MGKLIQPHQRRAVLEERRRLKMARSTHAYVRGTTAKFYDWLASSALAAALPQGRVRQCGVKSVVASGQHFQAALGVICSG